MDKGLSLRDCHNFCEHVSEPDRVDEVEVVQSSQVIIVVQEDTIVMKELGSW